MKPPPGDVIDLASHLLRDLVISLTALPVYTRTGKNLTQDVITELNSAT